MTHRFIIGLAGEKGAGKKECAGVLRDFGFAVVGVSDAIQAEVNRLHGLFATPADRSALIGEAGQTYSQLVKKCGQDMRARNGDDYLTSLVEQRIVELAGQGYTRFAVRDIQRLAEVDWLESMSAKGFASSLWWVDSTKADKTAPPRADHAEIKQRAERIINNDDTLPELHKKAFVAMSAMVPPGIFDTMREAAGARQSPVPVLR